MDLVRSVYKIKKQRQIGSHFGSRDRVWCASVFFVFVCWCLQRKSVSWICEHGESLGFSGVLWQRFLPRRASFCGCRDAASGRERITRSGLPRTVAPLSCRAEGRGLLTQWLGPEHGDLKAPRPRAWRIRIWCRHTTTAAVKGRKRWTSSFRYAGVLFKKIPSSRWSWRATLTSARSCTPYPMMFCVTFETPRSVSWCDALKRALLWDSLPWTVHRGSNHPEGTPCHSGTHVRRHRHSGSMKWPTSDIFHLTHPFLIFDVSMPMSCSQVGTTKFQGIGEHMMLRRRWSPKWLLHHRKNSVFLLESNASVARECCSSQDSPADDPDSCLLFFFFKGSEHLAHDRCLACHEPRRIDPFESPVRGVGIFRHGDCVRVVYDVFSVLVATVGALLPQFRHPLDHEDIDMWKGGRCSAAFVMLEYVHSESVLSNVTCAVLSKDFGWWPQCAHTFATVATYLSSWKTSWFPSAVSPRPDRQQKTYPCVMVAEQFHVGSACWSDVWSQPRWFVSTDTGVATLGAMEQSQFKSESTSWQRRLTSAQFTEPVTCRELHSATRWKFNWPEGLDPWEHQNWAGVRSYNQILTRKYGVEIRILFLSKDLSHSWVRSSPEQQGARRRAGNLRDAVRRFCVESECTFFASRSEAEAKLQRHFCRLIH